MPDIPPFQQVVVFPTIVPSLDFLHTMRDCGVLSDLMNIHEGSFLAYYIHIGISQLVKVIILAAFFFGQL